AAEGGVGGLELWQVVGRLEGGVDGSRLEIGQRTLFAEVRQLDDLPGGVRVLGLGGDALAGTAEAGRRLPRADSLRERLHRPFARLVRDVGHPHTNVPGWPKGPDELL